MGGWGSGRRRDSKRAQETVKRIDIRFMHQQGLIQRREGFGVTGFGSLSWSCNGRPTGSVGYEVTDYGLILNYHYAGPHDTDMHPVQQTIRFDRTPCHYGGERLWFLCPRCPRRVLVVYGAGREFCCRHCYRLNYASQHERFGDRMQRKARRIRRRLKASDNLFEGYQKPKGMHWRTFQRLQRIERAANNGSLQSWLASIPRKYLD